VSTVSKTIDELRATIRHGREATISRSTIGKSVRSRNKKSSTTIVVQTYQSSPSIIVGSISVLQRPGEQQRELLVDTLHLRTPESQRLPVLNLCL